MAMKFGDMYIFDQLKVCSYKSPPRQHKSYPNIVSSVYIYIYIYITQQKHNNEKPQAFPELFKEKMTQLNDLKYCYLAEIILFNINPLFVHS